MAGMTKWQARKAKKKEKKTSEYEKYLNMVRKGGRTALRKAMTQYGWNTATKRTRELATQKARMH